MLSRQPTRPGSGVRIARFCCAIALASSALVSRAVAQAPSPGRPHGPAGISQAAPKLSGAGLLEKVWPGHPEWLAMLADIIVKGDRLEGTDGWFRKDRPQIRFDWRSARSAWDRDGNGSVSRSEFPGTDIDFARLDRVSDGAISPADFDFSTGSSSLMPGSLLFGRSDRDGNGKVTRAEFDAFFRSVDPDGSGSSPLVISRRPSMFRPAYFAGHPAARKARRGGLSSNRSFTVSSAE